MAKENNKDKLRNIIKGTAIASLALAVAGTVNQKAEIANAGCSDCTAVCRVNCTA